MIILITGSSHTGKTSLAQRLLEYYKYPYLSLDHLKMGLIRSGYCTLSPESSDEDITLLLWPIVKEIIKTNIENKQNLIIEGCYIPFEYKQDFEPAYLTHIKFRCLIFSEEYIQTSFHNIRDYANAIETRKHNYIPTQEDLIRESKQNLRLCALHNCEFQLIQHPYKLALPF